AIYTQIMDRLATAPGEGRYTPMNFEESVRVKSRNWTERFANLLNANQLNPDKMTLKDKAMLRHVMVTGETTYNGEQIAANIISAGGRSMRRLMDEIWRNSRDAGLDIGYSDRYFPRMYDLARINADKDGFKTAASEVYKIQFDKEVGTPGDDPQALLERWTTLSKGDKGAADPALQAQMQQLNRNLRRQRAIEELQNPTPAETAELAQLKLQAEALAKAAHDPLGDHVSELAAANWFTRVMTAEHTDFDTTGPTGQYL